MEAKGFEGPARGKLVLFDFLKNAFIFISPKNCYEFL